MSFEPFNPNFENRVRGSFSRQGFMKLIGAKLMEVRPGYCEIHVGFKNELTQQHGFFHAGVIGTIADTSAGYAAFSLTPADSSILSVEYKLSLMAPGDGDLLIGRARVIKPGRTLTICQSDLFVVKNESEKQCATALVTLMNMSGKSDGPVISDLVKTP